MAVSAAKTQQRRFYTLLCKGHFIYFGALFLSKTLSSRSKVPESKSGHTSILRPLDSTTRKALAPRPSLLPFVPANATATSRLSRFAWMCPKRCLFKCRCRVLGGKPCLRQNSISRNPLASNSIASRSTSSRLLRLRIWTSCFPFTCRVLQKLDAPKWKLLADSPGKSVRSTRRYGYDEKVDLLHPR